MGREIRKVIPNWEHPKHTVPNHMLGRMEYQFMPLYDRPFAPEMEEWYANWKAWQAGTHEDFAKHGKDYPNYWDWSDGPPDPKYYRPDWKPEEMTWLQVYETVSEGTPVSPPFPTTEALIEHLVNVGDFWDGKWTRKNAEAFVKQGFEMTMSAIEGEIFRSNQTGDIQEKLDSVRK